MVNQEFRIDVIVDPAKAKPGTDQVGRRLDALETQASELRNELVAALSVRDQGVSDALNGINATLMRTEENALITDARISQIGRDIRGEGIDLVNDKLEETKSEALQLRDLLGGIFAGISVAFLAREFIQLSDEATNLRNRLRAVSDSEDELVITQQRLLQIANDTRGSLDGTVTVYQRLKLNQDALGVSTERLFLFTTRLNQAIALSGLTAEESRNGIIQLSQGLASGALRGDELRSVLEQLPPVAKLIADRLGVTIGELRSLGAEGKITSEIIIDAISNAQSVADQFAESVPTIGQAFTVARNQLVDLTSSVNDATGANEVFSRGILLAAENMDALAIAASTAAVIIGGRLAAQALPLATAATAKFLAGTAPLFAFAAAAGAVAFAIKRITDEFDAAAETLQQVEEDAKFVPALGSQITAAQREINSLNRAIAAQAERGVEASDSQIRRIEALQAAIDAAKGTIRENTEAERDAAAAKKETSEAVQSVIDDLQEESRLLMLSTDERKIQEELNSRLNALVKEGIDLDDQRLRSTREQIEGLLRSNAAQERQNDLLDRIRGPAREYAQQIEDLRVLLDEGRISQEEFNKAVEDFKPKEVQRSERDPFAEQIQSLREANQELQIRADNEGIVEAFLLEQAKLEREIGDLNLLQKLELFGQVAQKQLLIDQLAEQKKEEQEIAKARQEAEREAEREERRIERLRQQIDVQGTLQAQIEEINRLFGDQADIQDEVARATENLRLRQLDASNELAAGFERAFIRIKQEAEDLAAVGEEVVNVFADRATEAIVEFARTGEFNFKKFANAVLDDLIRILVRLLVVQAISAAFGVAGGGAAPVVSAGLNAGRQGGGTVQPGQRPFPVNENGQELFVPDRTGTIVPSAATQAANAKPPEVNTQVVVVQSMEMVPEAISSGVATEAIIVELGKNKDRVNQVLS